MKKWLLAVLPATALAAPPQGFYQNYQDWDIACDNTGTCRLAGYQADETETPVSILFTRKAGANAAVAGEVSLLPFNDDDRQLARVAARNELMLNGKSLGKLALNKKGQGKLNSAQTNALLEALKKESQISIRSGNYEWHLSDKGAAAAMLKADEFQGRLNTPSALIRKGDSSQAVLNPQPKPVIRAVAVPQKASYMLEQDTPRHSAVMKLLSESNRVSENDDNYCPALHDKEHMDWNLSLSIYPLNKQQVLVEAICIGGAYQTGGYYAIANKELTKIEQVLPPMTYGGHGGFDEKTATLSGSFKGQGIGDCWSGNAAVWDGKTFVRSEEYTTGSCKGFTGGAWLMPVFEARVER
ncbi:MAG: DUF1176 domain-containing protein [Neisseria sp.]|uniref:DUF1176 domain-containing protein n=1 Tax=Neisseria sp. TaxID=192066 RepID=UPI001CB476C3|nr:DUF1176 domain-containing protein [Neisseria sp.]MBF1277665.1 DUF1176 domain-containing protein [Neisseria sp.]MBF1281239.1 DUF1176 domain-containing protein [Neisseria sp.]